jgi:3-hydroxymyristoyl/3-hydroxydecanoyl-(acyl carrier protein) dehydratase
MPQASWHVPADHPTAAGHFPGNPVIPGALLLDAVLAAIAAARPGERCLSILSAKFLHPVAPGATLVIDWTAPADGTLRFTAGLPGAAPAVQGLLRFGP